MRSFVYRIFVGGYSLVFGLLGFRGGLRDFGSTPNPRVHFLMALQLTPYILPTADQECIVNRPSSKSLSGRSAIRDAKVAHDREQCF